MKRESLLRSLLALLTGFFVVGAAMAQTSADPNEGSRLTYDSQFDSYDLSWWGKAGRTYFIQQSNGLSAWEYLTLIESGNDDILAWSFTSTSTRFFLRVRSSDIPTDNPFYADFDGDKVGNYFELVNSTDPLVSLDTDNDGMPDDWERWHLGNLLSDGSDDSDGDGLLNLEEFLHSTNPNSTDSDYDGLSDGDEVNIHHTDPLKWDTEDDGLPDGWEVLHGLAPLVNDAAGDLDTDGLPNLSEYGYGTDPQLADTDGDALNDGDEVHLYFTSPLLTDTDGDGLSDGAEVAASTDPNDPDSDNDGANDGEEVDNNTNPNSDQSHPPVWRVIYRTLQYDFDDYPADQGGRRGWLTTSGSWPGSGGGTVTLSTEIAWPALSGRLASEVAFPVTKPAITGGLTSTYGYAGLIPNPPCYHATLLHARVWLEVKPAATEPVTRKLPKVTERSIDGQSSAPAVEMVEITIPAGQSLSPPTDLTPTFTTNPAGNQSHSESVKQSLLPVEITFEPVGDNEPITDNKNPITNQWMPGKGKRIFPDWKKKNDNTPRNRVYVKVKVGMPNIQVHLKAFDVDDPSNDLTIDPNDQPGLKSGQDNLEFDGITHSPKPPYFIANGSETIVCTTDAEGIAKFSGSLPVMEVTMQPGDNFRVAATLMSGNGLTNLQVMDKNAESYIGGDSNQQPNGFNGVVSPMLTSWRKLHIEVDTMTKWQGDKPSPDRVMVAGVSWQKNNPLGSSVLTLSGNLPEGNDFYAGGFIKSGNTMFDVTASTENSIKIFHGSQNQPSEAEYNAFIGPFELHDDDDRAAAFNLFDALPRYNAITPFVRQTYAPAYIEIEEVPHSAEFNARPTIPFQINTGRLNAFTSLNTAQDMGGADRNEYWYHFVVMAYQYTGTSGLGNSDGGDGDPNTENGIKGGTIGGLLNPYISVIFLENIRDPFRGNRDQANFFDILNDKIDHVVPHEIGHTPGGKSNETEHAEGGLMGDGAPDDAFSPKTLYRFRTTHQWQD